MISGNASITRNAFGIHFADQGQNSRNTLSNVTVTGNNITNNRIAEIGGDGPYVVVNPPVSQRIDPPVPATHPPRALGIDTDRNSRCYKPGGHRQGGTATEIFTISASDDAGWQNLSFIHAAFIHGRSTTPDVGLQGCRVYYDRGTNTIKLDGPTGGGTWDGGESQVGSGGVNLTNSYCTVDAGASEADRDPKSDYILRLRVKMTFTGSASVEKHIYSRAGNGQGTLSKSGDWDYWGSWKVE
jgi:hypothetical protein